MLTLILLRHAEAPSKPAISDIDRTLSEKGIHDAHHSGEAMKPYLRGDLQILSSPAIRALHTAGIVMRVNQLSWSSLSIETILLRSSEDEIIDRLKMNLFPSPTVLLTGHNPVIQRLIYAFSAKMPSSGISPGSFGIIQFREDSWEAIEPGKGKLTFEYRPE